MKSLYTGAMLKKNKTLTSLRIVSCELCPEGLYKVCTAVTKNMTLTSLDLSDNDCGDYQSLRKLVIINNQYWCVLCTKL